MIAKKLLSLALALILTFGCMGITAFAGEAVDPDACTTCGGDGKTGEQNDTECTACFGTGRLAFLDTDTNSTKEIEQKYDATVTKNYADVNKVQVSWTIPDIIASVTINKKWNTKTLTWDTESTTDSAEGATAEFNFVNLSSVKVAASVSFTAESAFANTTGKTDKYTETYKVNDEDAEKAEADIDSAIADRDNNPEIVDEDAPTAKIEYTITPQAGAFTHLTETQTDAKFGTYTVKIHAHAFASTWSSDDTNHRHECPCGEKADEAGHDYNDSYVCKTCGYQHTHTYSNDWSNDETSHWHASTCGHDVKADEAEHSYDMSDFDSSNHWNVCECGAKTDIAAHTYDDTTGNCVCGAHEHKYASTWSSDGTNHWHSCPCGESTDLTGHTPEWKYNDSVHWQACTECSAKLSEEEGHDGNTPCKCGKSCLAAGTKITMADSTTKNIEDIVEGDEILTFNHEKGIYEGQKVYLAWKCESPARAFTLNFTNGISISVIGDHCFFEQERLTYVTVFESNAEDFIGRHFYNATAGRYEELLTVTYGEEPVEYYEIYTEYNANCIAEGLLNVAMDSVEMLNIYKFNEDLTADLDQLAADIAEYGLYEYPADATYPEKYLEIYAWKYMNIIVGKGLGTREDFDARRDAFLAAE